MSLPGANKSPGDLGHTDDHNAIVNDIIDIRETYLLSDTASATYFPIAGTIDGGEP